MKRVSILAALLTISSAWAQESADTPKSTLKIDWIAEPSFRLQDVNGKRALFDTRENQRGGWQLLDLTIRARKSDGSFDEVRLDLSGFGGSPEEQAKLEIRKKKTYRAKAHYGSYDDRFSLESYGLGMKNRSTTRRNWGASVEAEPNQHSQLDLGFDRIDKTGIIGKPYKGSNQVLGLASEAQTSANRYWGRGAYQTGGFVFELRHDFKDVDREHSIDVDSYRGLFPWSETRNTTIGSVDWSGGPLEIQARYTRVRSKGDGDAWRTSSEPSAGGVEREVEMDWKSNSNWTLKSPELAAQIQLSRPVALELTLSQTETTGDSRAVETKTQRSFDIPFIVTTESLKNLSQRDRKAVATLRLDSVGPVDLEMGGGYCGRDYSRDTHTGEEGDPRVVDQNGWLVIGGANFSKANWTAKIRQEWTQFDRGFSGGSAVYERKSRVSGTYAGPKGVQLGLDYRYQARSNPNVFPGFAPASEERVQAITLSAGLTGHPVEVVAGCTYADRSAKVPILMAGSDISSLSLLDSDFWNFAHYLALTWKPKPGLSTGFTANYFDVGGDTDQKAYKLEPWLKFKLLPEMTMEIAAYYGKYESRRPESGSYEDRGLVIGALFWPR